MLLSHDKRFIFIHIPKTAGMSITSVLDPYAVKPRKTQLRRLLSHLPLPEDPSKAWLRLHDKAGWVRTKLPREVYDGYYKFAVVRNPYDRAVSYYYFLRGNRNTRLHRRSQDWSFIDYLEYLARKDRRSGVTQSSWITDWRGRVIVDEVLRFESLGSDFPRLLRRLGIADELDLPHINSSQHGSYQDMFGPSERAIADRLFAPDLALFGYSF